MNSEDAHWRVGLEMDHGSAIPGVSLRDRDKRRFPGVTWAVSETGHVLRYTYTSEGEGSTRSEEFQAKIVGLAK
jgi:hypothetical protein